MIESSATVVVPTYAWKEAARYQVSCKCGYQGEVITDNQLGHGLTKAIWEARKHRDACELQKV